MFDDTILLLRTVAPLRWEQWVYRPLRRVQALLPLVPKVDAVPDTRLHDSLRAAIVAWGPMDAERSLASARAVMSGEYRFLNHTVRLSTIDWSQRHVSHLWNYNLHYFDYALDLAWAWRADRAGSYADRFTSLARDWIAHNPPGQGDGWQPYALSLRVVNWMYALLLFGDAVPADARAAITRSLAAQLGFLERRLELNILGNHLQKNLKALVVGGLFFTGAAPERWLRRGGRLLWRELLEQVLADGCHYERSPMYHAIALGDFLELSSLCNAVDLQIPEAQRERVRIMVSATGTLIRPDGRLHLFNDAANGVAPMRSWLNDMAEAVLGTKIPSADGALALPLAGYYGFHDSAAGERLLVDCGEAGPAYQPGHAHCDLLSFELDIAGRPLVVDSGVCGYDGDRLREYVRSTRAHNTVTVDGREQLELWGTFRVARRARPLAARQHVTPGGGYAFRGEYAPYYDRRVRHMRTIERGQDGWRVTDRVAGCRGSRLDSFVHMHPDCRLTREGDRWIAVTGDVTVALEPFGADAVTVHSGEDAPAQGWHCPEFGTALPAPTLRLTVNTSEGRDFGYVLTRVESR